MWQAASARDGAGPAGAGDDDPARLEAAAYDRPSPMSARTVSADTAGP
jgi:hypothetical protein